MKRALFLTTLACATALACSGPLEPSVRLHHDATQSTTSKQGRSFSFEVTGNSSQSKAPTIDEVDIDGTKIRFHQDQLMISLTKEAFLDPFLKKYNAEVITQEVIPEPGNQKTGSVKIAERRPEYLIKFAIGEEDQLDSLEVLGKKYHFSGHHRFKTKRGALLYQLALRIKDENPQGLRGLSINDIF